MRGIEFDLGDEERIILDEKQRQKAASGECMVQQGTTLKFVLR